MAINRRSFYRESLLSKVNIDALSVRLNDDFVEIEDYREKNRRVWISLDHVEAVAVDSGKLFNWRYPEGSYDDLKKTLMNRYLREPSVHYSALHS